MTQSKIVFESRIQKFLEKQKELAKKIENWTWLRGGSFIIAILAGVLTAKYFGNIAAILVFLGVFSLFLFTVSTHLKLVSELKKFQVLIELNRFEINRLNNQFDGLKDGLEFANKNHFYASDLDLFGKHSLFQLLNRAHTYAGKYLLSQWLKNASLKNEILERQVASQELCPEIDFRQDLEVIALLSDKIGQPFTKLLDWIQSAENEKVKKPIFQYGIYLPFATFIVLGGAIFGLYTYYFVLLALLIQGIILKIIDEDISNALDQTEAASEPLKPLSVMMQIIESKDFKSKKLVQLASQIKGAAQAVKSLQKTTHFLSYRSNPVAALGGIIFMNDLRNFIKLEKWRRLHKQDLPVWLAVISEFEALNSLASYRFANPTYCMPQIEADGIILKTRNLSHPLIQYEKRVANNFSTEGLGKTIILTGSNMSGKSTFERTIGINIVLALMGGVVPAEKMECSVMQVFTSMRTQDSLENDTSSFYAELKRLQQLIQQTKSDQNTLPIFYLLDEILKGTNSKDRHSGAKALILQLKNYKTSGIISTHDVELGDEFEGQDYIKNYSFSSEMVDNQLVFDYKLKTGVCHSFNATELMRRIGIDIIAENANKL